MERPDSSEIIKIGIVIGILVFLLGGFILLRMKKVRLNSENVSLQSPTTAVSVSSNQMYFKPAKIESTLGGQFDIDIYFRAKNKILFGADAIISFDPNYLEITEVKTATYFREYPRKKIDKAAGILKVTGYNPVNNKLLSEDVLFATLKLKAKKKGVAKLTFDYQMGSTNKTTLVEKSTSKNILDAVSEAEIDVK